MNLYDKDHVLIVPRTQNLADGRIYAHRKEKGKPFFGHCPLCSNYSRIIYSHINPNWSWINPKRSFDTKEKLQGGEAFYLLCSDCDSWMGKYESYLTSASQKQITDFMVTVHSEKISLGLLAIFWRASVVQSIWKKEQSSWDQETQDWAKDLLLECKRLDYEGEDRPESILKEEMHWAGLKFFTSNPLENNPYGQQAVAHPEVANDSRGHTFIAGIFWNLRKGKGKCGVKLRYWSDEMREASIYEIDISKSDSSELTELASTTPDDAPCPCGIFETTGIANELRHPTFSSCCKNGWLQLPVKDSYWRDAHNKLFIQVGDDSKIESDGSMTWNIQSDSDESLDQTLKNAIQTLRLKDNQAVAIQIRDEATGEERMFLVSKFFVQEFKVDS